MFFYMVFVCVNHSSTAQFLEIMIFINCKQKCKTKGKVNLEALQTQKVQKHKPNIYEKQGNH